MIDFIQDGVWAGGHLHVENMQPGEYSLAVCDDSFDDINENTSKTKTGLNVYPNPSNGIFYIDTNQPGTLTLYDLNGKIIDTFILYNRQNHISWSPGNLDEGTYIARFITSNDQIVSTEKLVYIKN